MNAGQLHYRFYACIAYTDAFIHLVHRSRSLFDRAWPGMCKYRRKGLAWRAACVRSATARQGSSSEPLTSAGGRKAKRALEPKEAGRLREVGGRGRRGGSDTCHLLAQPTTPRLRFQSCITQRCYSSVCLYKH
mgnify:CR=1 FL=1